MPYSDSFNLLISYLKRSFSNSDIEMSREFMGGFEGANDFSFNNAFRVRSVGDLEQSDFLYELQWGIYESGVVNISNISNKHLGLYLATIYLYGDRVRPMSGDCDMTTLLIFVKGIAETKDQKLILMAADYLRFLNSKIASNLTSNLCYRISELLILFLLRAGKKRRMEELVAEIESYGVVVDDVTNVSFEDLSWIEDMINSIRSVLFENPLWILYAGKVSESIENNFGVKLTSKKV